MKQDLAKSLSLQNSLASLQRTMDSMPVADNHHYNCEWCEDTGRVLCYKGNGENIPMKVKDAHRKERELDYPYIVACPCGFCDAGTYQGRPTAGSLKTAERWVKENVTQITALKGVYDNAKEEGFTESIIDEALKRVGIAKTKLQNGRWMCEPL